MGGGGIKKTQNRRNRPHRPIGRCEEGRMGREPSNTHPEGEELGNHCHPLERGGVIGRGRPRSCKRRARRQPARQRRTPQLGRMHKPLARRTMERKEGKRRRRGGKEEEKEEKERRKQERKEEEEEEERRERRRREKEKRKKKKGGRKKGKKRKKRRRGGKEEERRKKRRKAPPEGYCRFHGLMALGEGLNRGVRTHNGSDRVAKRTP